MYREARADSYSQCARMFGVQIPVGEKIFFSPHPSRLVPDRAVPELLPWVLRPGRGLHHSAPHLVARPRLAVAQFVRYNVGRQWVSMWRPMKQQWPYLQHCLCVYVRDTRSVSWVSQSLDCDLYMRPSCPILHMYLSDTCEHDAKM